MANLLTLARVGLIFLIVAVWGRDVSVSWPALDLLMVPLLGWAIFMDALDGWAARRWKEESEAGALFDIAGDRIVELTLWVFFATRRDTLGEPLVALWVPMALITRTVLTDFVRSVAFGQGRTPFGAASMQTTWWARQLTASRWSRGAYGVAKAVCFCALGLLLASRGIMTGGEATRLLRMGVDALVHLTVAFSLIRAVPVLWDGHRLIVPLLRPATPRPSR